MIEAPTPRRAPGLLDGAAIVVTAVELALAGYIWRFGPAGRIPMHFGLHGEVNGWGDRTEAAALIGGLALAMGGLYAVLPAMALGRAHDETSRRTLGLARASLLIVPAIITGLFVYLSLGQGAHADPVMRTRVIMAVIALLLLATGVVVGKVGPNPFVGVRTPWSSRSRLAWDKSNRLLGRMMFWTGLAGLLAAPLAPQPQAMIAFILASVLAGLLPVYESWRVWKHDPERSGRT